MPVTATGKLHIYVLNVGQADTAVIRTPEGKIMVIDAVAPDKIRAFLESIGLQEEERIEELVITHPHRDHYSGANSLVSYYDVQSVSLAPSWHEEGWGTNQYREMVNTADSKDIHIRFVAGYSRIYPDDFITEDNGKYVIRTDAPYLELLGPPNSLVRNLEGQEGYGPNHLSVMARMTWMKFSMVFAADAQMENWAHFDSEGMLTSRCKVLKAAHHGSKNGTQWERIDRLRPGFVIVPSEREGGHHIPDAIGGAIFKEYHESGTTKLVALTEDTGTVEIEASKSGRYQLYAYKEPIDENVPPQNEKENLSRRSQPTNWEKLVEDRL